VNAVGRLEVNMHKGWAWMMRRTGIAIALLAMACTAPSWADEPFVDYPLKRTTDQVYSVTYTCNSKSAWLSNAKRHFSAVKPKAAVAMSKISDIACATQRSRGASRITARLTVRVIESGTCCHS
jgi:hypothetical protein